MDVNSVKKTVARIKTGLFKNSNSYSVGMLKSHFRGSGLQFKEHQVYSHGDDVRFIDWKMLAKTNHPYIKTFEEERNVEIVAVIDASPFMMYGYKGISKLQAAIEICCLLYLLAKETGDFVHTTILSDGVYYLPKKSGDAAIAQLISLLNKIGVLDQSGNVNIHKQFDRMVPQIEKVNNIMKHLKHRREVVMLSDFNDFLDLDVIKKIIYRNNVHCFKIVAPLDESNHLPYSVFAKSNPLDDNGSLYLQNKNKNDEIISELGKKFKVIKVQERYLESFIKEMM